MRLTVSLLIMALILVACGGGAATSEAPPPTEGGVSSDPTYTPAAQGAPTEDNSIIIVTPQSQVVENSVPSAGTLVYDSEFVDEGSDAVFDRVVFTRSGGGDGAPVYLLIINQDGTYELNFDTKGQIAPETVTRIDDIIDEINFFGISTLMVSSIPNPDKYRYAITVERGGTEMTLNADDGLIPQEITPLFGAFMSVIANSDDTAFTTDTETATATP